MKQIVNKNKINNKGVALISVLIAVAFISTIASALLYITYTNFMMKSMNLKAKENYYETDGRLVQTMAGFRNKLAPSSTTNPETVITSEILSSPIVVPTTLPGDPVQPGKGKYNVSKIAQYAFLDVEMSDPNHEVTVTESTATKYVCQRKNTNGTVDTFTIDSTDPIVLAEDITTGGKKYTFKDLTITQKNSEGYENCVKTDVVIKVVSHSTDKTPGGVGEFSMLMDGNLTVDGSDFNCLTIFGDSYFGNYGGEVSWDGGTYTAPGKNSAGKAALVLKNEAKLNAVGDYMVVYGDLVLKDSSCLYVNNGNLTVYGDIIIEGNATLICAGQLYMVADPLPDRGTEATQIVCTNPSAHIYPSDLSPTRIEKSKYKEVCALMNLNDGNSSNNGIIYNIMNQKTDSNKAPYDLLEKGVKDSKEISSSFYGLPCGIAFNSASTDTINGNLSNYLLFNFHSNPQIRQSNVNTTIISKNPINMNQAHSIVLTKIGAPVFHYLTEAPSSSDPMYDANVHDMSWEYKKSSTETGKVEHTNLGKFFDTNCNDTVDGVLMKSVGSSGGVPTYSNSLNFENYAKDFRN